MVRGEAAPRPSSPLIIDRAPELASRCFVTLEAITHPALRQLRYPELFSRLREAGLAFDMVRKRGLGLCLVDSHTSGVLSAVAVGSTPSAAFGEFRQLLDFIEQLAHRFKMASPQLVDPGSRVHVELFLQYMAAFKYLHTQTLAQQEPA